jgi:hypothetical protein
MRLATLVGGLAVIALGVLLLLDADDVFDLTFAALGPILAAVAGAILLAWGLE